MGAMLGVPSPLSSQFLDYEFTYDGFSSVDGLSLVGSAIRDEVTSELVLAPLEPSRAGAIWYLERQPVAAAFQSTFSLRVVEPVGGGGEGFAFVIQNQAPTALGQAAGLGYGGIANSLAVELDSRRNPDETFAPHVSIQSLGTAANSSLESASLAWFDDVPNWRDGAVHEFEITYSCGILEVAIDGFPALSLAVDLNQLLVLQGGYAWIGLTAGTGIGSYEEYRLTGWSHRNEPVGFIYPQVPNPLGQNLSSPTVALANDCSALIAYEARSLGQTEVRSAFFARDWQLSEPLLHSLPAGQPSVATDRDGHYVLAYHVEDYEVPPACTEPSFGKVRALSIDDQIPGTAVQVHSSGGGAHLPAAAMASSRRAVVGYETGSCANLNVQRGLRGRLFDEQGLLGAASGPQLGYYDPTIQPISVGIAPDGTSFLLITYGGDCDTSTPCNVALLRYDEDGMELNGYAPIGQYMNTGAITDGLHQLLVPSDRDFLWLAWLHLDYNQPGREAQILARKVSRTGTALGPVVAVTPAYGALLAAFSAATNADGDLVVAHQRPDGLFLAGRSGDGDELVFRDRGFLDDEVVDFDVDVNDIDEVIVVLDRGAELEIRRLSDLRLDGAVCGGAVCLGGGRFRIDASFMTAGGAAGPATGVTLTDDSAYLWFFRSGNVEAVVKVLDGCAVNGHHWVFMAGLTNVRAEVTVTDTESGQSRTYTNPLSSPFQPIQDTGAFSACGTGTPAPTSASGPARGPTLDESDRLSTPDETGTPVTVLACAPSGSAMCLNGSRYRVEATYTTPQGATGSASTVPLTADSGYLWFFRESNVELLVKVLDGCPVNQRTWVFAAGLTNVAVDLVVTDTDTGEQLRLTNPLGRPFPPIYETSAFASCDSR